MKIKPLLSCEVPLDKVKFPIYISTKFDGIRALVIEGVVYSRSLKPIRNKHVQKLFGKPECNGFDGELIVGDIYAKDVFQKTTSGVMSEDGTPDVTYYVFDVFTNNTETYKERLYTLNDKLVLVQFTNVVATQQWYIETEEELTKLLSKEKVKGGEGLIGRNPNGVYKYGRSTPKEQFSMKFKFFEQEEFEVVGFNERMHNTNEQKRDELGYAERSSARDGLVPTNTLGSLVLKYNDTTFSCGTGFDDKLRKEIWDNKELYLGKLASIRYMSVGSKDLPRVPSFIGFRHTEDIS
jgi:DNA ligase-1